MAETTLKTRIKLLYKSYVEWQAIQNTFYPLAGEVCITHIPQSGSLDVCMIKIGQWDGVDGSASKKSYAELPFLAANAADVYAWAKKENLDFDDLNNEFLAKLDARIAEKSQNFDYQIIGQNGVWKLQKREVGTESWTDVSTIDVASYVAPLLNKKVDKEITGTNGKALIFNESDGGGAKFEHNDGSESFVGVNDGGQSGLMAQIYADKLVDGKWQGAKLDVYNDGIYYTVGNKSAAERKNSDNELVVKKDIKDIAGGMHFIGVGAWIEGSTIEQMIANVYSSVGKSYADRKPGDLVILKSDTNDREFVCDSNKNWVELGDQGLYATKAELAAEASERSDADAVLQANIDAEASTRAAEDAKKVDKEIVSAEGKALIFNEADGGGAKFENVSGIDSFVGVNNGGVDEEGIAAQIYAVDRTTPGYQGTKIDITQGGAYYTKGPESGKAPSGRDKEENEIAVKGDVADAVYIEQQRAMAVEATKADLPGECPPWLNPTGQTPYPWFMASLDVESAGLGPDAQGNLNVNVGAYNFNAKQYYKWEKSLPFAATQSKAGLMTAADKAKLDHFYAKDLTQETGDVLILDCNL